MKQIAPDIKTIYVFVAIIIYTAVVQKIGIENAEKIGSVLIPLFFIPYLNSELDRNGMEKEYKKKLLIISSVITFIIVVLLSVSVFGVPIIPFIPNYFYLNNALIWAFLYTAIVINLYKLKKIKNINLAFGSLLGVWILTIILAILKNRGWL
ncbi:MAG: hypothetical protein KGV57_04870 [Fusobacterium sp.]|nr:hypothetical protein [Fusobacterium sp.]